MKDAIIMECLECTSHTHTHIHTNDGMISLDSYHVIIGDETYGMLRVREREREREHHSIEMNSLGNDLYHLPL